MAESKSLPVTRLEVSAFPDGVSYIVEIDYTTDDGTVVQRQYIEGVLGTSVEDVINKVTSQITAQLS